MELFKKLNAVELFVSIYLKTTSHKRSILPQSFLENTYRIEFNFRVYNL